MRIGKGGKGRIPRLADKWLDVFIYFSIMHQMA